MLLKLLATVLCATVLLSACSSSGQQDRSFQDRVEVDFRLIEREEFLGGATADQLAAAENEFNRRVQESVSDCMNSAGFTYVPFVRRTSSQYFQDFTSLAYAMEHGFGVSEGYMTRQPATEAEPHDPNLDNPLSNTPEYSEYLEQCNQHAAQAVTAESGVQELRLDLAELRDEISTDREVEAASRAWSECAAEAGHIASDRTQLIVEFADRAMSLIDDEPALRQLHEEEVAAAVATFACSQDYDAVWRERAELIAAAELGERWTT